ncbi:hypothetical protein NHQ30_007990 [Ciborinia camelliae]|nr:hypothetical protein NHQ30_007990 [Ciborinia camelliae]
MARDEVASLRYLQWDDTFHDVKPYTLYMNVPEGFPPQNYKVDWEEPETIHDVRGHESEYSLDDNGFAYYKHHFELGGYDRETLERDYLPQVEAFLLDTIPNATEVKIYTWRLRSSDPAVRDKLPDGVINLSDPSHHLAPATAVHVDQSVDGAIRRVYNHVGDRAETLLRSRVLLINVWRPVRFPIEDYPLAVADGSTVNPDDLIAADYVRTTYEGENLLPLYNKNCRWHYLSDQTPDDILLFKSLSSCLLPSYQSPEYAETARKH